LSRALFQSACSFENDKSCFGSGFCSTRARQPLRGEPGQQIIVWLTTFRQLTQDGGLLQSRPSLVRAILTDAQFWLPVVVLLVGLSLLLVVR
jgi:hypothetical protein